MTVYLEIDFFLFSYLFSYVRPRCTCLVCCNYFMDAQAQAQAPYSKASRQSSTICIEEKTSSTSMQ